MAEVAKQPPEPLRSAAVSVGDDEDALADARTTRAGGEALCRQQRMAAGVRHGEIREVGVDVEEGGVRNVAGEIELVPTRGAPELPPAVDKLVPHASIRKVKVSPRAMRSSSSSVGAMPNQRSCSSTPASGAPVCAPYRTSASIFLSPRFIPWSSRSTWLGRPPAAASFARDASSSLTPFGPTSSGGTSIVVSPGSPPRTASGAPT